MIDIIWMVWVLLIGIIEALIQLFNKNIYLLMEEDSWAITFLNRKKK